MFTGYPALQVWVTGSVVDANTSLPLAGVNVSGSRGPVRSDASGTFATYAPVVDNRVIVTAAAFGNYSSQVGSAVFHAGVDAYAIPLQLNPLSIHHTFAPAAGLPRTTISNVYGRNVFVQVPPSSVSTVLALPADVTLSIAIVPPSSSPGLMESQTPGALTNSTTLQSAGP